MKKAFVYGNRTAGMNILMGLSDIDKIEGTTSEYLIINDNPVEFYEKPYQFLFPEGLSKEGEKKYKHSPVHRNSFQITTG